MDNSMAGAAVATELAPDVKDVAPDAEFRREPLEYLLDLRSKLMMTEIPAELEKELGITTLVRGFVDQLQIMLEMRDEVFNLYTSGHFDYQEDYRATFRFQLNGVPALKDKLKKLREEMAAWQDLVDRVRLKFRTVADFVFRCTAGSR